MSSTLRCLHIVQTISLAAFLHLVGACTDGCSAGLAVFEQEGSDEISLLQVAGALRVGGEPSRRDVVKQDMLAAGHESESSQSRLASSAKATPAKEKVRSSKVSASLARTKATYANHVIAEMLDSISDVVAKAMTKLAPVYNGKSPLSNLVATGNNKSEIRWGYFSSDAVAEADALAEENSEGYAEAHPEKLAGALADHTEANTNTRSYLADSASESTGSKERTDYLLANSEDPEPKKADSTAKDPKKVDPAPTDAKQPESGARSEQSIWKKPLEDWSKWNDDKLPTLLKKIDNRVTETLQKYVPTGADVWYDPVEPYAYDPAAPGTFMEHHAPGTPWLPDTMEGRDNGEGDTTKSKKATTSSDSMDKKEAKPSEKEKD